MHYDHSYSDGYEPLDLCVLRLVSGHPVHCAGTFEHLSDCIVGTIQYVIALPITLLFREV